MPLPRFHTRPNRGARPQQAIVVLSALLLAIYGAIAACSLQRAYEQAFAGAGARLDGMAASVENTARRDWYAQRNACLIEFVLFVMTTATLASLAVRALGRGQLAVALQSRSAARLNRQSALLQNTLDNIGEGLSVFDARGRLVARNSRFCELLNLATDMPPGTPLSEILMCQARQGAFGDVDAQAETIRRLDQFYRDVPIVKERVTSDGRTLQMRRSAMPDGAVLTIYSDVTDIRAAERRLLDAHRQAEAANQSKSEFLANMSHELRTPLNAIIGFTEIISHELFGPIANEKYLEYVKDVLSSSQHLLSIIDDVLDMSKIEAGKLELAKQAVTLQAVIGDAVRIVHERASSRDIELAVTAGDDPVVVWADERAMKQILLNLLSNAIKFSKDGGKIYLRVRTEPGAAVIDVEDNGIGMSDAEQERALLPFAQTKQARTRNYGGTGLGLPITKGLVEAHGGTLSIVSGAGSGTTVRVMLPAHIAPLTSNDPSGKRSVLFQFG